MEKIFLLLFLVPLFCFSQKTVTIEYPLQLDKDTIKNRTKIIDNIFTQDDLTLLVGSNGCFHSVSLEYRFLKKNDRMVVVYTKRNHPSDKTPVCKGTVILSQEKLDAIHKLCVYGLNIKQGMCTTRVDLELSSKTQKVSFEDDRCSTDDDIMGKIGDIVGVCKDL